MTSDSNSGVTAVVLAFGAIILLPVVYGAMGFVAGIIAGWIYNLVAKWTGGIEVEIE